MAEAEVERKVTFYSAGARTSESAELKGNYVLKEDVSSGIILCMDISTECSDQRIIGVV